MEIFNLTLRQMLMMFTLILVGFILRKKSKLPDNSGTVMSKMDNTLIEAARDLGCNGFNTWKRLILPLSIPGVVSGIAMVFVPSVSTFYISQKLGGGTIMLIGDTIERQMQVQYNYNLGAALSLVLMVLILVSMMIMSKFSDDDMEGGLVA